MSLTSLFIINTDPNCSNYIEEQITVESCSRYTVTLNSTSQAMGPFNIIEGTIDSYPIATNISRSALLLGVAVNLNCISPTPSPTFTPTMTQTNTPTPTVTPTLTMTPTVSPSPSTYNAYLFIEPVSINVEINQWMSDGGSSFRGFSNGIAPSTNNNIFESQINRYISYTGWGVDAPSIRTSQISTYSGGLDSFGNAIQAYLFKTHEIPAGTVNGYAWFTWIIGVDSTNGMKMNSVGVNSAGEPNSLTTVMMNSFYYDMTIEYSGSVIPSGTYRVYTTFGATNMRIDNSSYSIYFKGNTLNN